MGAHVEFHTNPEYSFQAASARRRLHPVDTIVSTLLLQLIISPVLYSFTHFRGLLLVLSPQPFATVGRGREAGRDWREEERSRVAGRKELQGIEIGTRVVRLGECNSPAAIM